MTIKITNWKRALLGGTPLAKVAMAIFFALLLLTIGSCMLGCATPQPTTQQLFEKNGPDLSTWPAEDVKIYMEHVHKPTH